MIFRAKQIVLSVVAFVIACVLVVGNIILTIQAPLLHQVFAGNTTDYSSEQTQLALAEGDKLVQEMAADSMVLLRNQNNALPLAKGTKINLFGWNASDNGFLLTGGGSGGTVISDEHKVTLTQALKEEGVQYNEELLNAYAAVSNVDADWNKDAKSTDIYNPDASFYTEDRMQQAKNYSDVAVVVLSRFSRENNGGEGELIDVDANYTNGSILELTENEKLMMQKVSENFEKVIVLLNTCNNMELGFLEDYDVDAAMYVGLPGQSGALAIPRLLYGDITPSGRTSDTFVYSYQPEEGSDEWYDPTWANAIYDYSDKNYRSIVYQEGIYVGYKWYETADAEGFFDEVDNKYGKGYEGVVQYPFGYGLSYADFEYEVTWPEQDVLQSDGEYEVKVKVTNVSEEDISGKAVVQLYYTPQYYNGGIEKAYRNLLAFGKTVELAKGQDQTLTLTFSTYDLASYDDYDKNNNKFCGYELDAGDYTLSIMDNAHEVNACENAEYTMYVDSPIKYETDPVSGEPVVNRFTGDEAYAGVPIDGSTVLAEPVDYLSRENGFENFPREQAALISEKTKVDAASTYMYDGYDDMEMPTFGADNGLYLVTNEDGSKASYAALSGTDTSATLKPNVELMKTLSNYEADEWDMLLDQLTKDEIKNLIGMGGFQTIAIESVGKPLNIDRDGPAGFNLGVTNAATMSEWTAFPVEALIGCSWNPTMAYSMGLSQGAVAASTGVKGWYAPGVNIHRSPYNTRNFEYYSEDAVLSGVLASEVVRGAKNNNLYCYVKHFAASEAGRNPNDKNTWLTEQAFREIYLKPFEMTVKEGGANGMMSCFNRIGAVWAGSNQALLTGVLRDEWGFRGTVITDWAASYMNHERGIRAGNDLWLSSTSASASIDMNNNATAYAARISAKNILYTYVDTYVSALEYQESDEAQNGITVDLGSITVTAAPFSPLFVSLWVVVDVILVGGMVGCIVAVILTARKNKKTSENTQE